MLVPRRSVSLVRGMEAEWYRVGVLAGGCAVCARRVRLGVSHGIILQPIIMKVLYCCLDPYSLAALQTPFGTLL